MFKICVYSYGFCFGPGMNPFDSVEIRLPKCTEKTNIEAMIKQIEGLNELEEEEDGELPYNRYLLKENAIN